MNLNTIILLMNTCVHVENYPDFINQYLFKPTTLKYVYDFLKQYFNTFLFLNNMHFSP